MFSWTTSLALCHVYNKYCSPLDSFSNPGILVRVEFFFLEFDTFLIFNLKILPIWFSQVSRCHLKAFFTRISNRSYFLTHVVLRFAKLSPNLSTYRWDTLYKQWRQQFFKTFSDFKVSVQSVHTGRLYGNKTSK